MKYALITGISGGLGANLASEFLKAGYYVFGADLGDRDISGRLGEDAKNFTYMNADVCSSASVNAMLDEVGKKTKKIDLLINCAAILPPNSAKVLEEFDIDASAKVHDVNALGPLRVVKAALPYLRAAGGSIILNITSEAGTMQAQVAPYTYRFDYCMSKAGLNMQSIILQRYLAEDKVKVILVHPGWMRTEMGGAEAPTDSLDTAKGILKIVEQAPKTYELTGILDYDGTPRAW